MLTTKTLVFNLGKDMGERSCPSTHVWLPCLPFLIVVTSCDQHKILLISVESHRINNRCTWQTRIMCLKGRNEAGQTKIPVHKDIFFLIFVISRFKEINVNSPKLRKIERIAVLSILTNQHLLKLLSSQLAF